MYLVDQQPVRLDVAVSKVFPVAAKRLVFVSWRAVGFPRQQQDHLAQLRRVLAALPGELYVAAEPGRAHHIPHQIQIPRSLNSSPADVKRLPFPLSAARSALTVVALGIFTSNGSAFSAATRTSSMRTASDTEIPIPANAFVALCLVFSS